MKLYFKVLLLIIASLLAACVREDIVNIKPDSEKDKLVVIGLITPAENVYVQVGKSQTFGSGRYEVNKFQVEKAVVTISTDNGKEVHLQPVKDIEGLYIVSQKHFPIEAGKTYHLKVEAPTFETVTATTTVPLKKAVWNQAAISGYWSESYGGTIYQLMGDWQAVDGSPDGGYGVSILYPSVPVKYLRYDNQGILPQGDKYTIKRDILGSEYNQVDAVLITRDKNYNEFSKVAELTWDVLAYYHNAAFADIMSGFKGVIPEAGNIQNGLGVFGSYLYDSRTIYKSSQ